jgi:hypothetical protein
MTWTYSAAQLSNPLYMVRLMIGDNDQTKPQLQDEEITVFLSARSTFYGACAECCRSLAAKESSIVDQSAGGMKITFSQAQKAFTQKAIEFEMLAAMNGAGMPYAGGISITDMNSQSSDPDRPAPQFQVGMHDNYLPVAPLGPEEDIEEAGNPSGNE